MTVIGFALVVSACDDRNLMPSPDANTNGGGTDGGAVCGLPFDVGPCDAAFQVWAFVGGDCVQQTYGGCQGNGNRFATLEECVATCSSQTPKTGACLPNRIEREICLACGPAGGCAKPAIICALICVESLADTGCPASIPYCYDDVCHYTAGCI